MNELKDGAAALGVPLSPAQITQFEIYRQELLVWNRRMNLTRIVDPAEVISKHFLDSLSCLLAVPRLPETVVDVGTGAGFPGLALKLAQPHLRLTLVESTAKKTRFLTHLVEKLALSEVTVLHIRAEELGHRPEHRGHYQLAVARAVTRLPALSEYLLPLLRPGGLMLAQKGTDPAVEVAAAARAIDLLGGRYLKTVPITVPGLAAERHLVLVKKIKPTPKAYPRSPGKPGKDPLG